MGIILKITFINIFNAIMKNEKKKHGKKTASTCDRALSVAAAGE